jgi:uncharacterized protein
MESHRKRITTDGQADGKSKLNPSRPVIWLIRLYQRWISPAMPRACRFWPTCSEYAAQAIEKKGITVGIWLAFRRLLRCHPFHPGGFDPVH